MRVAPCSLPDLNLFSVQAFPSPTSAARPYGATVFAAPDGDVYLYGMSGRNVDAARAARLAAGIRRVDVLDR